MSGAERLLADERLNATLSWVCVGAVLVAAIGSVLRAEFRGLGSPPSCWPSSSSRRPSHTVEVMLPWEALALAALPVLVRAFASHEVGALATYLSIAALALVLAAELDVFTAVEMNTPFAVGFVVVVTMATAGAWAVGRWVLDGLFGTGFLTGERALMGEFVASTVAGVAAGLVFRLYVRRSDRADDRLSGRAVLPVRGTSSWLGYARLGSPVRIVLPDTPRPSPARTAPERRRGRSRGVSRSGTVPVRRATA